MANWMETAPVAQPTTGMLLGVGAGASAASAAAGSGRQAPPGAQTNYVPTIDVTAAAHPGAAQGQPGSEFAPSAVTPGAVAQPNVMPTPNLDATMARLRAQHSGGSPDQSWMTAAPAARPTTGMLVASGHNFGPQNGGVLANIGAGTSETTAGLLGAPVWLANTAANLPIRGANALFGTHIPTFDPNAGTKAAESAFGLIGADPRNVQANNELDRVARAGGAGMASMLLPWAGVRALPALSGIPGALQEAFGSGGAPTMAAAGLTGGAAGQGASDSVPAPYKPLASLAGNIAGGGLPIGAREAGGFLADQAISHIRDWLAPLTEAGRERLAGQRIANAATDPAAVRQALEGGQQAQQAAQQLRQILADPALPDAQRAEAQNLLLRAQIKSGELVPGSQPTTYQLTGDQGLGNLERAASKNNPDAFLQRGNDQNTARVQALGSTAPTGSPEAVARAVRQRLEAMDAAAAAQIEAARSHAVGATEGVGGSVPVGGDAQTSALQSYGQRLRAGLSGLNDAARQHVSRLYDAIDPDGTLAVDMRGVKAAARDIAKEWPRNARAPEGDAQATLGVAQMQPATQSFRELQALRSRITTAMREELFDHGRTPTYAALSRLLSAVDETLEKGVENAVARDPSAAARFEAATYGPEVGGSNRVSAAEASPGDVGGGAGQGGGQGPTGQRSGTAGGDHPVPSATAARGRSPETALDFLIAHGGVSDPTGDLRAIGADTLHHRGGGRLVTPGGLPPDYARELLEGEGFLRPGSTIRDYYDLLAEQAAGRPQYRISEQGAGRLHAQQARETEQTGAALDRARGLVSDVENEAGLRLTQAEHDHAAMLVANGMHPEEAVRHAVTGGDVAELDRNAERNAVGLPGMAPGAEQADLGVEGAPQATWTPEKAAQYRAANAAHRERVQTFQEAPGVGEVLATGQRPGEWKLGDSQVAAKLFSSGKGAAERIHAFLKAGGSQHDLVSDLKDYAAFSLRRAAEDADGTLDPKKYAKWISQHQEALSAFPELRQSFENAATARRVMDETVARHAEARADFEKSAAGKFLGDHDPVRVMGKMLPAEDGAAQINDVLKRAGFNPAAKAGMRRAGVDFMLDNLRSNDLAGEERRFNPAATQNFLRRSQAARRVLYGRELADLQDRIADDIQRSQKSVTGTKLPGGSNTAQDFAAGIKHGGEKRPGVLGSFAMLESGGEFAKKLLGEEGLGKAIGFISVGIGNAMREAGLHTVNDLVTEAMLHPELARTLLAKVPTAQNARGYLRMLRAQMRALTMQSALRSGVR